MRLKRYKKNKISICISRQFIIVIFSIIFSFVIINYFTSKMNEILVPLAENRTKKYLTSIINNSTEGILFDKKIFIIEKDRNNEIKMITYDSFEATKLINEITGNIQNDLTELENSDIYNDDKYVIAEIPIGVIFENSFLKNIGPKIKIRLEIIGDVVSELQTEVKPYGINNALVELNIFLEAHARVVLPFVSKDIVVTNVIPISIYIVNGNIPESYISTYGK